MLYLLKLAAILGVTIPVASTIVFLGLFDRYGRRYGRHVDRISRFWSQMILRIGGITLNVNGLDQLDPTRQYIFMVNHQSNIDIPVLFYGLAAFQLRWIAKREALWVPLFGWAMWAAKHIAVNRSDRFDALSSLKKAQQRMAGGVSVVVFPEGTRSPDGRLLPFKRGGILLAVKTRAPIVPVTINGSYRILPKGDWRIRAGEIEVTVGAPLSMINYRLGTLRALTAQVRDFIEKNLCAPAQPQREAASAERAALAANSSLEKPSV